MPNLITTDVQMFHCQDIKLRRAFPTELEWFLSDSNVSGYAAEDDQIVLNPYTTLSINERSCVVRNEAIRIFIRRLQLKISIEITKEQKAAFAGTHYESDPQSLRETIISRVASGDPSCGKATQEQIGFASALNEIFDRIVKITCDEDSDRDLVILASTRGHDTRA